MTNASYRHPPIDALGRGASALHCFSAFPLCYVQHIWLSSPWIYRLSTSCHLVTLASRFMYSLARLAHVPSSQGSHSQLVPLYWQNVEELQE